MDTLEKEPVTFPGQVALDATLGPDPERPDASYEVPERYRDPWIAPFRLAQDSYQLNDAQVTRGVKGFELMLGNQSEEEEKAALSEINPQHLDALQQSVDLYTQKLGPLNYLHFVNDTASLVPSTAQTIKYGGAAAGGGAIVGGTLGGLITRTPAGALQGARVGAGLGYEGGGIFAGVQMNAGGVYADLRDQGISKPIAQKFAAGAGLVMGALEYAGVRQLTAVGRRALAQELKSEAGRAAIKDYLHQVPPGVLRMFGDAGSITRGAAEEATTEVSQDVVEKFADTLAVYVDSNGQTRPWEQKDFWSNAGADLSNTAVHTFRGGLGLGTASHIGGHVSGKGFKAILERAQMEEAIVDAAAAKMGAHTFEAMAPEQKFSAVMQAFQDAFSDTGGEKLDQVKEQVASMSNDEINDYLQSNLKPLTDTLAEMTGADETMQAEAAMPDQPGQVITNPDGSQTLQARITNEPGTDTAQAETPEQLPPLQTETGQTLFDLSGADTTLQQELDAALSDEQTATRYAAQTAAPQDSQAEPELQETPLAEDTQARTLRPMEARARVNQIDTDIRRLAEKEQALDEEFNRQDADGKSTDRTLIKLENTLRQKEALHLERDLITNGLMNPEDTQRDKGQLRISVVSKLLDRLEKSADRALKQRENLLNRLDRLKQSADERLQKTKDKGEAQAQRRETEAARRAALAEQKAIRSLQDQLIQVINVATPNNRFRAALRRYVNKVTNISQFKTATRRIDKALREMETKRANNAIEAEREKLLGQIDRMVRNRTVMKNGIPTSNLTADMMGQLKQFRVYAATPALADQAIADFTANHGANLHAGNLAAIPDADLIDYQMAAMARDLDKLDVMGLKIVQGNVGQMIADARDKVLQKKEAQRLEDEQFLSDAQASLAVVPGESSKLKSPSKKKSHVFADFNREWLMWNGFLKYITPKDPDHKLADMLDNTRQKGEYYAQRELAHQAMREFLQDSLAKAGFADVDVNRKAWKDSRDIVTFQYIDQGGSLQTAEPDRAQLIDIWMKLQDTSLHDSMRDDKSGNGWTFTGEAPAGQSFQEQLESALQPEDIAIGQGMLDFYQDYHARVNAVYREKYGIDLPMRENYSPVRRGGVTIDITDGSLFKSIVPGSAKTRTNTLQRLEPQNVYAAVDTHIDQWEHFISHDGFIRRVRLVSSNPDIQAHITENYGLGTLEVLQNYQRRFIENKPTLWDTHPGVRALMGSLSWAALSFKSLYQMSVQLSAGMAMWTEYSPAELAGGGIKMLGNLGKTEDAMRSSPILARRYQEGQSYEFRNALRMQAGLGGFLNYVSGNRMPEMDPRVTDAMNKVAFAGIRGGDALAARAFGGPVYWAELARGQSEADAMATVERLMEQTQQSDAVDQMPHIFANNQWVYFLAGMFRLQPLQLYGQTVVAARDFLNNPSKKQFAKLGKTAMAAWLVPGLLYGLTKNAPLLFGAPGDDDERDKEALADVIAGTALGPLNAVPMLGDGIEWLWWQVAAKHMGVDVPKFQADLGRYPHLELLFKNPAEALKAWGKLLEPEDDTEVINLDEADSDEADAWGKAIRKSTKAVAGLAGASKFVLDLPGAVTEALENKDYAGAVWALSGWSAGQISRREQQAESDDVDILELDPEEKALFDLGGVADAINEEPSPLHETPETETDTGINVLLLDNEPSAYADEQTEDTFHIAD